MLSLSDSMYLSAWNHKKIFLMSRAWAFLCFLSEFLIEKKHHKLKIFFRVIIAVEVIQPFVWSQNAASILIVWSFAHSATSQFNFNLRLINSSCVLFFSYFPPEKCAIMFHCLFGRSKSVEKLFSRVDCYYFADYRRVPRQFDAKITSFDSRWINWKTVRIRSRVDQFAFIRN